MKKRSTKSENRKGITGSPQKLTRLTINVPLEHVEALRKIRKETGVPVAFQVGQLITDFLAELGDPD